MIIKYIKVNDYSSLIVILIRRLLFGRRLIKLVPQHIPSLLDIGLILSFGLLNSLNSLSLVQGGLLPTC